MNLQVLKKTKKYALGVLFCFFIAAAHLHAQEEDVYYSPDKIQLGINRAEEMLSKNDTEQALEVLLYMFPYTEEDEQKTQIEFLIGLVSVAKQDFKSAEWVFRRILKNKPSLPRVRLELAMALFSQKKYEKADYHFRLVLGSKDLPPEVKQKIMFFLAQIRYLRTWNLYLNLGITPTDNVNNVSGAETECIDFGGALLCRELEKKRSSIGFSGYVGIENYLKITQGWRFKQTVSGGLSDHAGKEFDSYVLSYSAGPLYNFKRGYAGVYAGAEKQWYGGEELLHSFSALGDFGYDLSPRTSLGLYLNYKDNTFDRYEHMDGHELFIMPSLYWGISSKSYILFKPSANFFRTQMREHNKDSFKLAIGLGTELPLGISVYIEPSYTFAYNQGENYFIENNGISYKKKEDESFTISVRLLQRQIDILGFTPTLNYSYTDVTSNVKNQGYSKHTFEIGATKRF
ncbi:hypothetical protein Dip510_000148 [Elusimicrobium posterum]|uniref:surface lipoprotein assembly modifier n=1 Tax=Elusimicrobium posterum TaxID=3116653 RepID=UPI003C71FDBD